MPSTKSSKTFIAVALCVSALGGVYYWTHLEKETSDSVGAMPTENAEPLIIESAATPAPISDLTPNPQAAISDKFTTLQVKTINEIITSRNDNDPRLDSEFRNLSERAKEELRAYYQQRPNEDRNGRGTVVFVLGREIASAQDVQFFNDVLRERECQSLDNCGVDAGLGQEHSGEHDAVNDVTLAYPQMMALQMLERKINEGADEGTRAAIREALDAATKSLNPRIAQRASQIKGRYFP